MSASQVDFLKMKVTELRKELKSRGLQSTGDKSELVARLQAANEVHDETEYPLDSDDEIDSEGVLEDDAAAEINLDDSQVHDSLNDEFSDKDEKKSTEKPKMLKRKVSENDNKSENVDKTAKKIVLHRPASIPSEIKGDKPTELPNNTTVVLKKPVTSPEEVKSKLEMRAKRFGLPLTEKERKDARKIRFGQSTDSTAGAKVESSDPNVDKLKKRAERFGQSVSKVMTDVESQEKLERRRARFGLVK